MDGQSSIFLSGCSERLHDLRVGLMDTWPATGGSSLVVMDTICASLDGPCTEARYMTQCEKKAVGRYLVIQIDAVKSELSLCEVEVFVHQRKYWHLCVIVWNNFLLPPVACLLSNLSVSKSVHCHLNRDLYSRCWDRLPTYTIWCSVGHVWM